MAMFVLGIGAIRFIHSTNIVNAPLYHLYILFWEKSTKVGAILRNNSDLKSFG